MAPRKRVERGAWEWFGSAGHFCDASRCRFHLTTLVGPWLVSTVGEYLSRENQREFEEIGYGRKYETMVFRAGERCAKKGCGCGLPDAADWSELDSDAYNDAGSATRGHYAMCEKWAAKAK